MTQNQVTGSQNFGIAVSSGSSGSTISRNVVSGNGQDGIQVTNDAGSGTLVQQSTATSNAWLGINAPGVTDGGGDVAYGNGDPRQCVGVVCSAS